MSYAYFACLECYRNISHFIFKIRPTTSYLCIVLINIQAVSMICAGVDIRVVICETIRGRVTLTIRLVIGILPLLY